MEWIQANWAAVLTVLGTVLVAYRIIKKITAGERERPYVKTAHCTCGWKGKVSKHKPRCPKCGISL
jgi:predicted Zn-ribbon and HTH transcriptional regulator